MTTDEKRTLSAKRKADRETMAREIKALCALHGMGCAVESTRYPRETLVRLESAEGLSCMFAIDGGCREPDCFVLNWFLARRAWCMRIAAGFAQSRNQHHKRKATDVVHGFDSLMTVLADRFGKVTAGKSLEEPT